MEDTGPLPERLRAPGPGYVTPRGVVARRAREKALKASKSGWRASATPVEVQRVARELAYVRERLARAVVVNPKRQAQGSDPLRARGVRIGHEMVSAEAHLHVSNRA